MEYFKTITTNDLVGIIKKTKENLYLCLLSIQTEIALVHRLAQAYDKRLVQAYLAWTHHGGKPMA